MIGWASTWEWDRDLDINNNSRVVASGLGAACFFFGVATAQAGSITAQGNVTALTDLGQMGPLTGTADYDEGPNNGDVPLGVYTAQGITFFTGALSQILPGVVTPGNASTPQYFSGQNFFPAPIGGSGVQAAQTGAFGGAVMFTADTTKFGLTASRNGNQFITVWDKAGKMIGQVNWVPANDASFVGVDTKGVPIGLLTYGNDDLWNGGTYDIGGPTIISDHWVWISNKPGCVNDAACDDKNACNGAETCQAGKCVAGVAPVCKDDNVCTDDSCDPALGCAFADNVAPCDDKDACTSDSICAAGVCGGGGAVDCADDNACTLDTCDMVNGCSHDPIADCCLEDADCQPGELCEGNVCAPVEQTTGGSTGGGSTGGNTGEASTGGSSTGMVDPSTSGGTAEPTGTGGTSGTGGEGVTTTAGDTEPAPTTSGAPGSTGADSSGTGGDTEAINPVADDGCGCRSGGDPAIGGLGLLGLGLLLRRRRRMA